MIDHEKERLVGLAAAGKRYAVHPYTVARWIHSGCSGVRLESIRIGHKRYTSIEACQRFFEALTEAKKPQHQQTLRERNIASEEAGRELEKYGVR